MQSSCHWICSDMPNWQPFHTDLETLPKSNISNYISQKDATQGCYPLMTLKCLKQLADRIPAKCHNVALSNTFQYQSFGSPTQLEGERQHFPFAHNSCPHLYKSVLFCCNVQSMFGEVIMSHEGSWGSRPLTTAGIKWIKEVTKPSCKGKILYASSGTAWIHWCRCLSITLMSTSFKNDELYRWSSYEFVS